MVKEDPIEQTKIKNNLLIIKIRLILHLFQKKRKNSKHIRNFNEWILGKYPLDFNKLFSGCLLESLRYLFTFLWNLLYVGSNLGQSLAKFWIFLLYLGIRNFTPLNLCTMFAMKWLIIFLLILLLHHHCFFSSVVFSVM